MNADLSKKANKAFIVIFIAAVIFAVSGHAILMVVDNWGKPQGEAEVVFASPYDGSVWQVKKWIIKNAHDPDSLVFEKWGDLVKNENSYVVTVAYRSKNRMGAVVQEIRQFVVSEDGQVKSQVAH